MTHAFTIDRAMADDQLLGAGLGDLASWLTWRVVLKAAYGRSLTEEERAIFHRVAGARSPPSRRVRELWCVVGRRGGKSRAAATAACYEPLFVDRHLAPGEVPYIAVLAMSVAQANVVFAYCLGLLEASPVLKQEVASVVDSHNGQQEIRLRNGTVIAVMCSNFRRIRGRTLLAVVMDECAFWPDDELGANPDREIYGALLPSLATTNGLLVGISTPYRRIGLLHAKHRDYYGVDDDDVLVVQGPSASFNPTLSEAVIAASMAADPVGGEAEWNANFRSDLSSLLDDAAIDAAVDFNRPLELSPRDGVSYSAFVDASSGVQGGDHYTLAIGHKDDERYVADVVTGYAPPFDPSVVTAKLAELVKQYRISKINGDYYSAGWVESAWNGIDGLKYLRSEKPKSALYLEALPLFARQLVNLPDHPRLTRELRLLERSTTRAGQDKVDHGRGGHDDYSNVLAGMLAQLAGKKKYDSLFHGWDDAPMPEQPLVTSRANIWTHILRYR
jgi:Terminase large subunit, ATPase domain